jgi:hypothetical protein
MARNNDSYGLSALAAAARKDYTHFMQDGLLNVVELARLTVELNYARELFDDAIYADQGDINSRRALSDLPLRVSDVSHHYLTRVENMLNSYTREGRVLGERLGNWYVVMVPVVSGSNKLVPSIKHIHLSNGDAMLFLTSRVDKGKWVCDTCNEAVPPGVVWAARTKPLRRAL